MAGACRIIAALRASQLPTDVDPVQWVRRNAAWHLESDCAVCLAHVGDTPCLLDRGKASAHLIADCSGGQAALV
eukprot:15479536-Alexandrium_andersonii.AAC.1